MCFIWNFRIWATSSHCVNQPVHTVTTPELLYVQFITSYCIYMIFYILCFYYSFGRNFSCILVEWLWRGGLFYTIFLFCTCITWWWANEWPKHVAGSNKLNIQKFRCCGCVDWMFRNFRMFASEWLNSFTYCTADHSRVLRQIQRLPDDGTCGVPKHVGELTCEE
jgi:hypothetical protein